MHARGVKLLPTKVSCMQLRIQSGARETVAQSVLIFLRQNGCFPKSSHIYTVKSVTRTLFCPYLDAIVPKRILKVFDDTTFLQCTCISHACSFVAVIYTYVYSILTYFYANVLELIYSLVSYLVLCVCLYLQVQCDKCDCWQHVDCIETSKQIEFKNKSFFCLTCTNYTPSFIH